MNSRVGCLVLGALMAATASMAAQARLPIASGARVRVWLTDTTLSRPTSHDQFVRHRFAATVVRSAGDTVIVLPAKGGTEVVLLPAWLARLDVSGGRHRRAGRGALIGLAIGATGGAILGAGLCSGCGHGDTLFDPTPGEAAAIVGVVGGLAGLGLGALVGALVRTERWRRVSLGSARLSLASMPNGGVRAGLSIAIGTSRW